MEESTNIDVSSRRVKRIQSNSSLNKSPLKSDEESRPVISNGTGNSLSENLVEEEESSNKATTKRAIKITKVAAKSSKTEQSKEALKSPRKVDLSPVKITSPSNSPSSSSLSRDGFQGFEDINFGEEELEKRKEFFSFVENLESEQCARPDSSNNGETSEREEEEDAGEEMTVDAGQTSDTDSNQMEIDTSSDRAREKTRDSDVDALEMDVTEEQEPTKKGVTETENSTKPTVTRSGAKVEYCGGCEEEVNDSEEGICCDSTCERWFHLRCSGLSQLEYDELGLDVNAKWACRKCSGKPPLVVPAGAKPLLSVRKDLTKAVITPASVKRKSMAKEGSSRGPRVDISNPAFLKPFDFGWKRELVFRSTHENTPSNKRNGDIYYYTPKGKKLRSLREIIDHLTGSELTQDNFTFHKEPIGIDDPDKEIIRDAKLKTAMKDPLSTPIVVKKVTPKITKAVKPVTPKVTPKLTATVSPLECGGATVTKASASVTPRVVLKGKTSLGGNNRVKTTPVNKNQASTSQSQKVAQKLPSRKSSFSVGAKALQRISPNVVKSHRKADKNVKTADSITDKGLVQDIEKNRRNKFRRYGLLANAKARRKSSGEFSSSSDSDECGKSSPARSTSKKKTAIDKAMEILESDSSATYSDLASKENKVGSENGSENNLDKSSNEENEMLENKIFDPVPKTPLLPDSSQLSGINTRRPSPPEIQFRPGNPSSYGCQTQYRGPGPSSTLYGANTSCSFETVLIVEDGTPLHKLKNPLKRMNQTSLDPSLIVNNGDSSFKIISVDSLSSVDQAMEYQLAHPAFDQSCNSPTKTVQTRVNEEMSRENVYRRGTEDSPLSLNSSSTEDIIVIDEESEDQNIPSFLMQNSLPKLYPRSRSPPCLRPALAPPHLLQRFTPQTNQRTIFNQPPRLYNVSKQPSSSQKSNNPSGSPTSSQSGSKYDAYRKFKKERFYVRLKARQDLEKMKRSYKRERELFLKRKSEEKQLRITYLQLKVKMKQMKSELMRKKLVKTE